MSSKELREQLYEAITFRINYDDVKDLVEKEPELVKGELRDKKNCIGIVLHNLASYKKTRELISTSTKMIQLFIDKGADVNYLYPNTFELTPLSLAIEIGDIKTPGSNTKVAKTMASLLLKNKADINLTDSRGDTALTWAARGGSVELCKLLIEHGADVNHPNGSNTTPLCSSILMKNYSVAEFLIKAGANVNQKGTEGNYPLFLAVEEHFPVKIIHLMLLSGADVNKKGHKKGAWHDELKTPLEIAWDKPVRDLLASWGKEDEI